MNLKILCCNIRVDVAADGEAGNGWDHRKESCVDVIRAQNPDLICFQECTNPHYTYLRAALPEFDNFGLAGPETPFRPNNAIFYSRNRFELISAGGFWLSETPHVAGSVSWDSARPRFANWIDLRDRGSGAEFRMWNTHYDHIGQVARERQAQCINEASQAFPEDFPQLFAADCNADASNPAIDIMKDGGWLDTYTAVHGPEEPGHTYHAFLGPAYPEKVTHKIAGKLDFIFVRGPVTPLASRIIRDNRDGRYPSDHYFVSAEVRIG